MDNLKGFLNSMVLFLYITIQFIVKKHKTLKKMLVWLHYTFLLILNYISLGIT